MGACNPGGRENRHTNAGSLCLRGGTSQNIDRGAAGWLRLSIATQALLYNDLPSMTRCMRRIVSTCSPASGEGRHTNAGLLRLPGGTSLDIDRSADVLAKVINGNTSTVAQRFTIDDTMLETHCEHMQPSQRRRSAYECRLVAPARRGESGYR